MLRILKFWRQYVAISLIFTLLVSQTIRVDFFDNAQASEDRYKDIVSIYVDTETYKKTKSKINRYAEDIQGYLGSTRVSVFVMDPGTSTISIANQNEKLYYDGDGEKGSVSHLVGTVLIGDIPIPIVDTGESQFPSVYPYVDFVDKKFLYSEKSQRYIVASSDEQQVIQPEIWHGVINPAVGRTFEKTDRQEEVWQPATNPTSTYTGSFVTREVTSDIQKISEFLDKSHDFYSKKGVFSESSIPPRVFYYDGFLESRAFALEDLGAYKLYLSHAEEVIYNRYSKHFLNYINKEIETAKKEFNKDEFEYIDSLGFDATTTDIFQDEQLENIPDIHTKPMVLALMKKFHDLINKQALGDIRGFVRNAGRYNSGSEVRVDQPAINVSLMDYAAMNTLRKVNDKLEKHIDDVEVGFMGPGAIGAMPPFDSTTINDPRDRISRTYDAYIFGKKVSEIDNIAQCNIARGSDYTAGPYKQGILVEANKAFDVGSTTDSVENFKRDGEKRIDCAATDEDQSTYKTDVYWGKNIITNVDTANWIFKQPAQIGGYYDSVFSLGGMNEVNNINGTPRLSHVPGAPYNTLSTITPLYTRDCYGGGMAYMLQAPRGDAGGDMWPKKESGEKAGPPGITCLTKQEEKSQPTWEGNNVPYAGKYPPHEFDWIANPSGPSDDVGVNAPAGPKGICAYGQVAIYLAPKEYFSGATVNPTKSDFVYACLPGTGEKCTLQPGELVSQKCLPSNLTQYIQELLDTTGGSASIDCPSSNPAPGTLYKTACSILGDARNAAPEKGNWKNDYEKNIPRIDGRLFNSPCAGLAAVQKMKGSILPSHPVLNLCMVFEKPLGGGGEPMPLRSEDLTTYETAVFKDIDDSRVFHKSPTDEEIATAEKSNMTPSLPIDHDRYLTFSHTVGGEYTMQYPNVFRFDEEALLKKYSTTGVLKRGAGGGVVYPVEPITGVEATIPRTTSGVLLSNAYGTGEYILTPASGVPSQLSNATGTLIQQKYGTKDIYMIVRSSTDPKTGTLLRDTSYTGWTLPMTENIVSASGGTEGAYKVSRVTGFQSGSVTILDVESYPESRLVVDQYGSGVYLITPVKTAQGILADLHTTRHGQKLIEEYGSGAYLIAAYRHHLNDLGVLAWGGIKPGGAVLTSTPPEPPCWGGAIGAGVEKCENNSIANQATYHPIYGILTDEDIAAVIRAKRWLRPDPTLKMKQAIETGLSYSHQYGSEGEVNTRDITRALSDVPDFLATITGSVTGPPKLATLSGAYEIAYLGLTQFIPKGMDEAGEVIGSDGTTLSDKLALYEASRAEITALNISEKDKEDEKGIDAAPSDACGPPEGVDLFKWPSAIQCWIKSLVPIRIVGQACTSNSIGLDTGIFSNSTFNGTTGGIGNLPVTTLTSNSIDTVERATEFYRGSNLTYHISRATLLPGESIEARFLLTRDNTRMAVPTGSKVRIEVEGIVDSSGKNIDIKKSDEYIKVAPNPTIFSDVGALSLLQSGGKLGKISLRASLDIATNDGKVYTLSSDLFQVQVTDEYITVIPTVDAVVTASMPVTASSSMVFDLGVKNIEGQLSVPQYPIKLDIYDDVAGTKIVSDILITGPSYTLSDAYRREPGVLRLEFRDAGARQATQTIALQAGPVAIASFSPVSSALMRESNTLVYLRLKDSLGNPIAPDLHGIDVTASGGYFILENGEKKPTLHIDTIDSEIPLTIGSDIAGTVSLEATIDNTVRTSVSLTVFQNARIIVSRTGTPRVGGENIPVKIRVVGDNGDPIAGFHSLISLALPVGAGVFTPGITTIENGVSPDISYTPGRLAGTHKIKASVPGLGTIPDIEFSVDAGVPLYIAHTEDDSYMNFSLRDRYNNIVPTTLTGTISIGGSSAQSIVFSGGLLRIGKTAGYMLVDVPALSQNTLNYTDSKGIHVIRGIPRYVAWVRSLPDQFNFLEDYNARYTLLAGGTFLREGEDILYNTTPGSGQSLAVTTLLDTPYKKNTLFTILPGGGFALGESSEVLPEVSMSIQDGYPMISIQDAVTNRLISRALYRANNSEVSVCIDIASCILSPDTTSHIYVGTTDSGYIAKKDGRNLMIMKGVNTILSIASDGKITHQPGITLRVNQEESKTVLVMDIVAIQGKIGTIVYKTDANTSIIQGNINNETFPDNTIILDRISTYSSEKFSLSHLADTVTGYRYTYKDNNTVLDESKNGPEGVDSIGITPEMPGVGWKGTNRMMLSYAGGDTVGEASRWFQSYTLINLGDPVTHNDKKAVGTQLDGIDRSIGTQLTSSRVSPVQSFAQRDMDKDGYEDIVVQHADGYIELLLNLTNKIRSRGNIAYVPDLTSRGLSLGDFQGDGYADILGVDKKGDLVLLINDERRFTRQKLQVNPGQIIPTGITQFRIRDMDADKKDDIVYITEGGELSILYGTNASGIFDKKLLDATLGISLSPTAIKTGGAVFARHIPQISLESTSTTEGPDASYIWNEVYVQHAYNEAKTPVIADVSDATSYAVFDDEFSSIASSAATSTSIRTKNFARSEYAGAFGIDISKKFTVATGSTLQSGSRVIVNIDIKNTTNSPIQGLEYLDTIPKIFGTDNTLRYTIKNGNNTLTRDFSLTSASNYDAYFNLIDIAGGQSITLSYELTALPTSYGELLVGDYEQGETGADVYGDIGFKTDTTCGADMILWRSETTPIRSYTRGTRSFSDVAFSTSVANQLADTNNDGIPDSVANPSRDQQQDIFDSIRDTPHSDPSKPYSNTDGGTDAIGYDPNSVEAVEDQLQEIANGLSCGFGGGGCMALPMNWAPLSSGKDPVAFGSPMGDGFRVDEGVPLLSGLTRLDIGVSPYCYSIPSVWPISPMTFDPTRLKNPACNSANLGTAWGEATQAISNGYRRELQGTLTAISNTTVSSLLNAGGGNNYRTADVMNPASIIGAGGYLGIDSTANFLRIYATPTLTLGTGVGICFGGTARVYGGNPGKAVWPLAQAGNCLVMTKPMNLCRDDGTVHDGDIRNVVGLGSITDTWNAGASTNMPGGASCGMLARTESEVEDATFQSDILSYIKSPDATRLTSLHSRLSQRPVRTARSNGPLLSLNGASSSDALTGVEVSIDFAKPLAEQDIIKINNKRISAFPDFIMDWVSRQTDEFVNALFTPPNLIIIPPTSIGQNMQYDGTLSGLTSTFKKSYDSVSLDTLKEKMGQAYDTEVASKSASTSLDARTKSSKNNATSDLGKWVNEQQNSLNTLQDSAFKGELGKIADKGKGGIASMRAAYKLLGKLPLISISEKTISVDVPWILPQELDKYARSLDAYAKEINSTLENLCVNDPSPECLEKKASINAGPLLASINENLKRIEEYKNFPVKLQKYITWKQRYLAQILCYIETVQEMTTGWLKDNSIRFRKWAELWVLIRAIADGWQPLLDTLSQKDAQCAVCHNERYNAKQWKYKIISLLIPSIPVIQFPRWPDIVLDLSDVRLGFNISMPNFQFNLKPIRLPSLPTLSLPDSPNVAIGPIDVLPPIPPLPDLPDLGSMPVIKLPNLPPPPKIPKILGELANILKLLKLYKLIECYLNKTPMVPEWTLGDIIAQRTERQGYLPIDFIDINLPQISIPWIREIRVSSHVNFEIQSDFVTEFARAAVAPINEFNADLGRGIPNQILPNIKVSTPENININLQSALPSSTKSIITDYINTIEKNKNIYLNTDELGEVLKDEFGSTPELAHLVPGLDASLSRAKLQSDKETEELLSYQRKRFDTLRQYIKLQHDETAHMQNVVDILSEENNILAYQEIEKSLMVSQSIQIQSSTIAQNWNDESIATIQTTENNDIDELSQARDALVSRVKRMAAQVDSPDSATQTDTIPSTYTPNFQGIYIVTEKGTQTRLFDYTESLKKDDMSVKTDIDKDGDMDYLFLLDGALFLKRTTTKEPPKIVDTTVRTSPLEASPISAPDFFREDTSVPGNLMFSYQASQSGETIWQTRLFDRYLEWDILAQGNHDESTSPQHIIETFAPLDQDRSSTTTIARSLKRVSNPESFVIEGPKMKILTGALDFILSPGRVMYTGNRSVKILYGTGVDEPHIQKILPPHTQYSLDDIANVSFAEGTLYILYPSIVSERYTFSDELIGMPIVPGMHIVSSKGEVVLYDHIQATDIKIPVGSFYHAESVSRLGEEYALQVAYPNGFYTARIKNQNAKDTTLSQEVLFTPQAASDTSAPDVDIRDALRIPVYQKKQYNLRDIVTDTNTYTTLIDPDITQDTNKNGIYDDDFVASASGVTIDGGILTLGKYDTVGKQEMMLQIIDEFYNKTIVPITIQVYAPIPSLTQVSLLDGTLSGRLSEALQEEPINIFRIRPGSEILRIPGGPLITSIGGVYQQESMRTDALITLTASGKVIDLGVRGSIKDLPSGYSSRVLLATEAAPTTLEILDNRGIAVYRAILALPTDTKIALDATDTPPVTNTLSIRAQGSYNAVSAAFDDPNIPGGYYIVDDKKIAIIAIARDGNIYSFKEGVTTSLTYESDIPVINLFFGGKQLSQVLYKFDFFYTLK